VLATAASGDERSILHLERALGAGRETPPPREHHSLANLQAHLFEVSAPPERDLDERVTLR